MLRPRIIPCLLIQNKGLVKTVAFKSPTYIGDPINAVKIFNEKEADELMVLDIDATTKGVEPDFQLIEKIAAESRMPLCYGGGIKTVEQAKTVISLGVEKVAISSGVLESPDLIMQIATELGSQSVVVVLDVKSRRWGSRKEVWTHNGSLNTGRSPVDVAKEMERFGAGEIVINSIDEDGKMDGYDIELIKSIKDVVHIPITALGGAGSMENIGELMQHFGVIGAAAGSLFVFKGAYRAVLINYPTPKERDNLILNYFPSNS